MNSTSKLDLLANFQILDLKNYKKDTTLEKNKQYNIASLEQNHFQETNQQDKNKPNGYLVKSTAPLNVDAPIADNDILWSEVRNKMVEIAKDFVSESEHKDLNLTIFVHGYANSEKDVIERILEIHEYAQEKNVNNKKQLFFGYRWPSENLFMGEDNNQWWNLIKNIQYALESLPTLLKGFFGFSIISILVYLICLVTLKNQWIDLALFIGVFLFSIVLALIGLRLSNYFRDRDRASNYAVLDLVDFLRKLDLAIFNEYLIEALLNSDLKSELSLSCGQLQIIESKVKLYRAGKTKFNLIDNLVESEEIKNKITLKIQQEKKKIALNFIAHSMGAFVVTNVVRILSDVFDPKSIDPTFIDDNIILRDIGKTFILGRLVLLAPDIPVETIISRRANFLAPSLRRCQEAYIFSSEGDLALRLASTAANYFSFPAKTRFSGYKLGNITVKHFVKKDSKILSSLYSRNRNSKKYQPKYGFINNQSGRLLPSLQYLEIRASDKEHRNLQEDPFVLNTQQQEGGLASQKVTYFDCTDYIDQKIEAHDQKIEDQKIEAHIDPKSPKDNTDSYQGILTYALKKSALNLGDYICLTIAYFFRINHRNNKISGGFGVKDNKWINTHGGYFDGKFIQELICDLAFFGIEHVQTSLDLLDISCKRHQIQVLLSTSISQQTHYKPQSWQSFTFSQQVKINEGNKDG
jgi:hypothetical protein